MISKKMYIFILASIGLLNSSYIYASTYLFQFQKDSLLSVPEGRDLVNLITDVSSGYPPIINGVTVSARIYSNDNYVVTEREVDNRFGLRFNSEDSTARILCKKESLKNAVDRGISFQFKTYLRNEKSFENGKLIQDYTITKFECASADI